jgi:hypothetical protein
MTLGATIATLTAVLSIGTPASIQYRALNARYIDTNACRRATVMFVRFRATAGTQSSTDYPSKQLRHNACDQFVRSPRDADRLEFTADSKRRDAVTPHRARGLWGYLKLLGEDVGVTGVPGDFGDHAQIDDPTQRAGMSVELFFLRLLLTDADLSDLCCQRAITMWARCPTK